MKGKRSNSRDKLAAAMAKFSKADEDETQAYNGPMVVSNLGTPAKAEKSMWKSQIVSCGSNAFGQGFFQDIMSTTFKALKFDSKEFVEDLSCGSTFTAAKANGNLFVWGSGLPSGQLKVPTLIPLPRTVAKLSCGSSHMGVIMDDGSVYTWGSAENGMLGHGNKTTISTPKMITALKHIKATEISCGAYHTAVIGAEEGRVQYVKVPLVGRTELRATTFTNECDANDNVGMSPIAERLRRQEEEERNKGNSMKVQMFIELSEHEEEEKRAPKSVKLGCTSR